MAISRFSLKTENLATLGSYCYSASCSGLASATHSARQPSARACANCQARLWTGENNTKALAFPPTFIRGSNGLGEASSVSIPNELEGYSQTPLPPTGICALPSALFRALYK